MPASSVLFLPRAAHFFPLLQLSCRNSTAYRAMCSPYCPGRSPTNLQLYISNPRAFTCDQGTSSSCLGLAVWPMVSHPITMILFLQCPDAFQQKCPQQRPNVKQKLNVSDLLAGSFSLRQLSSFSPVGLLLLRGLFLSCLSLSHVSKSAGSHQAGRLLQRITVLDSFTLFIISFFSVLIV